MGEFLNNEIDEIKKYVYKLNNSTIPLIGFNSSTIFYHKSFKKIVINLMFESMTKDIRDKLINFCEHQGIPFEKILIISDNASYQNEKFLFGRSGFEGFARVMNRYDWIYKVRYGINVNKIYHCLNKYPNIHRKFVYDSLLSENLLDYGYVSFVGEHELPKEIEDSGYFNRSEMDYLHTTHKNFLPDLIEQTFFGVVTETHHDLEQFIGGKNEDCFITEKTIKSLISQPFMVVSQKGILSKLHDEGFETYPEIFDESYDNIDNPIERINFIVGEIKRLCSTSKEQLYDIFEKVRWKVEHNYSVLKSFKQSEKIIDLLNPKQRFFFGSTHQFMEKHMNTRIITAGCSFTNGAGTWPYHIDEKKYGWVHNVGSVGVGNSYISRAVIWEVNNSIRMGLKPNDIKVLIMWSGISRKEFLSTVRENPMHKLWLDGKDKNWFGNFIRDEGWNIHSSEDSTWIKSSIPHMTWDNKSVTKFLDLYWKHFYSEEESLINTFESILRTQWYLNSLGIKYKMMCWQNIFNQYSFKVPSGWARSEGDEIFGHEIWNLAWRDNTQFKEDRYWPDNATEKISRDTPLLKDIYPNATYLWDMIDWDKWWFYEDEQVEYGGLAEWVCLKARDPWGNGERDPGHPSPSSHKKFCEQVIIPILEENDG